MTSISTIVQNNKRLLRSIASIVLIKGAAVLVALLTIPAYMAYFSDNTVLGIWYSMLSILNLVVSFDLGLGNGLRNKLAYALEEGDEEGVRGYVSSSYIIVGIVSVAACILSFLVFPHIEWSVFFNIGSDDIKSSTLLLSVQVVFLGLMLQFSLKLIFSILYAQQRSELINATLLVSNTLVLVFVLVFPHAMPDDALLSLSVFYSVAINIPVLVLTLTVFSGSFRQYIPSPRCFDLSKAKAVLTLGLSFFFVQAAALVIGNTNEILITWFSDPADVVDYQIYYRIFSLFVTLFNLLTIPIWSAATQKLAQGNYSWIRKCHLLLLLIAAGLVLVMFALVPFLQAIVNIWLTGNSIVISPLFGMVFVVATGCILFNGASCCIANGLSWLKMQTVLLTIGGVANIPLAWFFISTTGSWIGVEVANAISLLPVCVGQPIYLQKRIRKMEKETMR